MIVKFYSMIKNIQALLLLLIFSTISYAQIKRAPVKYNEDSLKTVKHDTVDEHYVEFTGQKFFTLKFGVNTFPFGSNSVDYFTGNMPNQADFQYGRGYEIKGNYGVYFNENFALEWNLHAIIGAKNGLSFRDSDSSISISVSNSYSVNSFLTGPSITYQSKGEYWFPYARVGYLFGASQKNIVENINIFDNTGSSYFGKLKLNSSEFGGLTTGYTIDLGIMKKIDKKHLLFVEIGYNSLNQTFKNGSLDVASFNGNDVLNTFTTQQKETIFVDKLTSSSNNDPNKPLEVLKEKTILNSIGIKFGCKFLLN